MNYPEYQVGRILERPTYENRTIVKREDDMIYVRAYKSNDVYIWMLCDEIVSIWKPVPIKESPMAWLKEGVEYWTIDMWMKIAVSVSFIGSEPNLLHMYLGLAWRTKEECEAYIKGKEEEYKMIRQWQSYPTLLTKE